MHRTALAALLALALLAATGCGFMSKSSGVMKLRPNKYRISVAGPTVGDGTIEAQRIAINEANAYCAQQGKEVDVKNIATEKDSIFVTANEVNITFQCLAKSEETAPATSAGTVAEVAPAPGQPLEPAPGQPLEEVSSGSGFFVSAQGHVVTTEHVAAKCRELRIADVGTPELIAEDMQIDLALLKVPSRQQETATFRSGRGIRTGDDITIAGYPLQGLLASELNVTKGTVSALAGPGDDRRLMQITAPVQPGNSGGPALDVAGNVVGVVVAKLDAIKIAKVTGSLPENVNFAISEGAVRAFLDAHGVLYETAPSSKIMPSADVAAKAKAFTVLIECWA
jgi:hypothetical protein